MELVVVGHVVVADESHMVIVDNNHSSFENYIVDYFQ